MRFTIPLKEAFREGRGYGFIQCSGVKKTKSGFVFCVRPKGHDGNHRGVGAEWETK